MADLTTRQKWEYIRANATDPNDRRLAEEELQTIAAAEREAAIAEGKDPGEQQPSGDVWYASHPDYVGPGAKAGDRPSGIAPQAGPDWVGPPNPNELRIDAGEAALRGFRHGVLGGDQVAANTKFRDDADGPNAAMKRGLPIGMGFGGGAWVPAARDPSDAAQQRVKIQGELEQARAQHPTATAAGEIGGAVAGPDSLLGVGAAKLLRVPQAVGRAARVARASGAGALSGGASAAARTGLEGGDLFDALNAARFGAGAGAVAGAGGQALSEAARGGGSAVANKLRDDRSVLGFVADDLKELDGMRASGEFVESALPFGRKVKDPYLANLPAGKKGYVKAAQDTRDAALGVTDSDVKAARADYGKVLAEVESDVGDSAQNLTALHTKLDEAAAANRTTNGTIKDEALEKAIDHARKMLVRDTGVFAHQGAKETYKAPVASMRDVLSAKKAVDELAQHGVTGNPQNLPYKQLSRALSEAFGDLDTRLKDLNARYRPAMDKAESANEIMLGDASKDAHIMTPLAKQRAATTKLMRYGDDTTAGLVNQEDLTKLADLDPRYADAIKPLAKKKAIERTGYGFSRMSKSPEKWLTGIAEQQAAGAVARVVDPAARALANAPDAPAALNPAQSQILMRWLAGDPVDAINENVRKRQRQK